ncbi:MAG: hypothetical protein IJE05_07195 [Clostridia bacterium]|nr:hypothetical protein [Clostridia bacterium]
METIIGILGDFIKSIFNILGNRKKVKLSIIQIDMFRLANKFEYQVNAIIENHSNLPISITNMYAIFNKSKYAVIKSVKFPINIPAFEAKNVVIVFRVQNELDMKTYKLCTTRGNIKAKLYNPTIIDISKERNLAQYL